MENIDINMSIEKQQEYVGNLLFAREKIEEMITTGANKSGDVAFMAGIQFAIDQFLDINFDIKQ